MYKQDGRAIEWGWIQMGPNAGYMANVNKEDVITCLKNDANDRLPMGSRYELRQCHVTNYGRTFGMAWFRIEEMDAVAAWGEGEFPRLAESDGYYLVGQFVTPSNQIPLPVTNGVRDL